MHALDKINTIQLFQGYNYAPINHDEELIIPWLNHVKKIICKKDEDVYNIVLNYFT